MDKVELKLKLKPKIASKFFNFQMAEWPGERRASARDSRFLIGMIFLQTKKGLILKHLKFIGSVV